MTFISKAFFLLLPFFFALHALLENYHRTLITDAIELWLAYSLIAGTVYFLFWWFYKHHNKAAIATIGVLAFYFFFAGLHDFLKSVAGSFFIVKYIFFLPVSALLFLAGFIYLKKTKRNFTLLISYLKLLLLVITGIDAILLFIETTKEEPHIANVSGKLASCSSCPKPDIYLLIADEYAGKKELEDIFSFKNNPLESELEKRGFHIISNSISNYNATVYSMASIFNMGYIKGLKDTVVTHKQMLACRSLINKNKVADFFSANGYTIYNYSFFEFNGQSKSVYNSFYPTHKALLMGPTFFNRFKRDLWFNFASKKEIDDVKKNNSYSNGIVEQLTKKIAAQRTVKPKFVYAHFDLPHHPFYFDRYGHEISADLLTDDRSVDKKAYIDYLLYANKKYLELIDHILSHSAQPPIIILMSDHGFRQFTDDTDHGYQFMNLNAVLFPDKNYEGFYDGMSNVNQFRVVLSNQFGQHLPILNDSTSFFIE